MSANLSIPTNKRKRKNPPTSLSSSEPSTLTPLPVVPPRTEKRISCQRCRTRKIKCNYELPCFNCKRDGYQCIQPIDMRSKRLKAKEVITLQKKLDLMIKFINDCKKLPSLEAKQQFISQTNLDELINVDSINVDNDSTNGDDVLHVANHHDDDVTHNNSAIYGPTSIYDDSLMHNHHPNTKNNQTTSGKKSSYDDDNTKKEVNKNENKSIANNINNINIKDNNHNINTLNNRIDNNVNNVDNVINKMNKDPDILKCIQLFFIWQYPDHNMFIFREAFLIDFFNPKKNMLYCSKILILSICSLGAKMSTDETIYNRSKEFYQESKYLLLNSLHQPSITSLQSFMLLAFYDICNGQNSSGWMLSGCAMRMGYDLGFQLNPELWFVKSKGENNTINNLSKLDVEIRSRIYWGCYMADHFISLLLGRPSILKISDASIPVTSDLPDLEWIDDFTYNGYIKKKKSKKRSKSKHQKEKSEARGEEEEEVEEEEEEEEEDKKGLKSSSEKKHRHQEVSYISDPLNQIINLINISDNILNDIFTKTDEEQPQEQQEKSNEDLNLKSRWEKLSQYNSQIMAWKKNLPKDLRWNRTKLGKTGENPTYSGIRYYYYILLLCLNRPFVGIDQDNHNHHEHQDHDHDDNLSPLSICLNAIDDLYESINRFQKKHGYRGGSIFIVYASILSISILLLTNSRIQLASEQKNRLHFFMDVLYGCSKTWKLAEKSYNLITEKLKHLYEAGELKDVFEFIIEKKSSPSAINTSTNGLENEPNSDNNSHPIKDDEFKSQVDKKIQVKSECNQSNTDNYFPTTDTTNIIHSTTTHNNNNNNNNNSPSTFPIHQNIIDVPTSLSTMNNGANNGGGGGGSSGSSAADFFTDDNVDFLGGPPVLMTADLFNEDWESLFPDYIFNSKN
ncbi:Ty1 enhancer activator, putative [Candida dubliniensis CD36]|uniref:Ty1 enhancer activator, putative n=1 Tax=Candida dubliniensis (strain CD36 / ATCC MYA-646 / CBS 7987 / NCPF 3949 / NRRL Y-17841) TaxID=573826 RepID=B9WED4_CANDC|nr:Ty1 enhancer activator, putative [Candida dubliniensis CD36]CAX43045.1 Ty1 enhancer activator, putative [Candida dubliniensis CD36]